MRRSLVFFGAITILAALQLLPDRRNDRREPASVPQKSAIATTTSAEPAPERLQARDFLREYSWTRKIESRLVTENRKDPSRASGGSDVLHLVVEGVVRLAPVMDPQGRMGLKAVFEGSVSGSGNPEESSRVLTRAPFVIIGDPAADRVELSGAPGPEGSGLNDRNLLRDWAALYAFHSRRDPAGEYRARFFDEGAREIKVKEQYPGASATKIEILDSRHELERSAGAGREVVRIAGRERTRIPVADGVSIETGSSYEIRLLGVRRAAPERIGSPGGDPAIPVPIGFELEEGARPRSVGREELERRFASAEPDSHASRIVLFHEWVRLLTAQPPLIGEFRKLAEEQRKDETRFQLAIGVMASVPAGAAQDALVDWYGEEGARPAVQEAILTALAVSRVAAVPRVTAFLEDLSTRNRTAALALEAVLNRR